MTISEPHLQAVLRRMEGGDNPANRQLVGELVAYVLRDSAYAVAHLDPPTWGRRHHMKALIDAFEFLTKRADAIQRGPDL